MERSQADDWFASCLATVRKESSRPTWLRAELKVEERGEAIPNGANTSRVADLLSPQPVHANERQRDAAELCPTGSTTDGLRPIDVPAADAADAADAVCLVPSVSVPRTAPLPPGVDAAATVTDAIGIPPALSSPLNQNETRLEGGVPGADRTAGHTANQVDLRSAMVISRPQPIPARSWVSTEVESTEISRIGARVRAAELARAGNEPTPMRVTACWTDQGVSIWVGADASALAQLAEITQALRHRFAALGMRVVSMTCNGRSQIYESHPVPAKEHTREGGPHGH